MRKHGDQSQTLGLFFLTVLARMGCFFGCFGLKDGNRRRPSFAPDTASSNNRGTLASQNQLSKLFKCEEEDSLGENLESHGMQVTLKDGDGDDNDKELKDQAKFLKSCGTLLHTPIELRKGSTKRVVQGGDSCKELNWDEKPNQVPLSSVELHGESERMLVQENLASPGDILRSFKPEGQKEDSGNCTVSPKVSGSEYSNTLVGSVHAKHKDNALSSVAPEFPLSTTQCKIKSVRFERDSAVGLETSYASLGSSPNNGKYNGGQCYDSPDTEDSTSQLHGLRRSPYATPLNLTDEMQTPGTVYPKELEKFTTGKNSQVQSQFVHPALNAIDDISQWNALNEDSKTHQAGPSGDGFNLTMARSPENLESVRKLHHVLDQRSSQLVEENFSDQNKRLSPDYARSQSSLFLEKPLSGRAPDLSPDYARLQNSVNLFLEKPLSGRAPDLDRPIIGAVAVHWKEEELPKIHLKGWDGNGIPNSTTKYKEDQKVSWHATPFEERLEKALSDERLLPRKLLKGNQILFEEREESDTASSFSSMNPEATTVQL